MGRKKIKNPLIKRIPKEIIGDWKKYLVVFLFLVLTIGFVSGMYVANDSMLTSADEGVSKYKQEDGHFELKDKADSELVTAIESGEVKTAPDEKDSDSSKTPVKLYENFYRNETEDYDADGKKDGTIRVYTKTGDINLACLIEGSFPQNENEIAVDRMHADNVGMKVGDTIKVSGKEFKVSGLIAYVNYSTLHEKKTDMMFDAIKFDVAMVTKEGFDRLDKSIHYTYAWKYKDEPADDIEQKEKSDDFDEEVSVYGVETDSAYVKLKDMDSLKDNEVYISDSFADKYGIKPGDTIKLDAQYEKKTYKFKVRGTYDKSQSIAVFMPIEHFADTFDFADGRFSGFLSDTKIKDIDESNIATTITIRDITKMADQLDHSMGSYMQYFQVLCILLSAVMIYLLTKLIIEKNETAISMTKILGYDNREIASLYLVSTSIVVVISDIISVVLGAKVMDIVWRIMLQTFSGWFSFHMTPVGYVKMFAFVLIGYLIVTVFDFRRIKRIPMDMALKNVE